jgi:2,5-diamino-6-(ribosylamino)-4(3H)-pyrimidinone 5'-phosphate reductase
MKPKVIMHTQISLDGCIRGFDHDELYYVAAGKINADMVLFGSNTVVTALKDAPPETKFDFAKPNIDPNDLRPYGIIPDSRGRIRNLHAIRNMGYLKDVIMLVSESTPKDYLEYLEERNYEYVVAGKDRVDFGEAFEILYDRYPCRLIRTDSGGELTSILLEQGLVDEVEVAIIPVLLGGGIPLLAAPAGRHSLTLIGQRVYAKTGTIMLRYRVDHGQAAPGAGPATSG